MEVSRYLFALIGFLSIGVQAGKGGGGLQPPPPATEIMLLWQKAHDSGNNT